jgi:hypothetical protein
MAAERRRLVRTCLLALLVISVSAAGLHGDAVALPGDSPASAPDAAGQITNWTATEAALPTNAGTDPLAVLGEVVCPADGSCVATGDYSDTSGNQQGLIETLSGGNWTAMEAPLPANAGTDPRVLLGTAACPAPGSCVATGSYTDTSGSQLGLIVTLSGGIWTAMEAPLPANADGNPSSSIGTPACPAPGSCVATGSYTDTSGSQLGLIVTLSGGIWTAMEAPLPGNADGNPSSSIGTPACPADGSCVTTEDYTDTSGNVQSAIETLSGGIWTAIEAPMPTPEAAPGDERNLLGSVTCPAPGSCVAVGSYAPTNGDLQGLIETLSGGIWTPTGAPLPANAPATNAYSSLDLETCPAVGDCIALGWYYDTAGKYHVVMESLSGGIWSAAEQPLPAHPAARNPSDTTEGIGDVACPSTDSCFVVGSYFDQGRKDKSIIETLAQRVWSTIKAPLPTDTSRSLESNLHDDTCSPDGTCVAVAGDPLIETLPGGESAPAVSSADAATFTVGQDGSFPVTASGTPAPSITEKGKLPKGLRFTAGAGAATISGIPTGAPGSYHITIEAQNGVPPTASQFFTVTIVPD